jgi:1-acyl-sn-glycerol-3-phosphate acyltransferase
MDEPSGRNGSSGAATDPVTTASLLAFCVRLATGVRLHGALPDDGRRRVYFANHSSNLDSLVIWAALPDFQRRKTRPVAAAEYWERGPLRRWLAMRVFDAVLIPRDRARMRVENPLGKMLAALDGGSDLIIFPEGTRSPTGEVAPFKAGLHRLATQRPGVLLVPVYLENLSRILPKGERMPIPLMAQAVFGPPLEAPGDSETKPAFLERARAAVLDLARGSLAPGGLLAPSSDA